MKLSNWIRFSWDLRKLPRFDAALPEHYEIGAATVEDETELRKVISSAFVLDPAWNPATQEVMETIDAWLGRALAPESNCTCLALRHGSRNIRGGVGFLHGAADLQLLPRPR